MTIMRLKLISLGLLLLVCFIATTSAIYAQDDIHWHYTSQKHSKLGDFKFQINKSGDYIASWINFISVSYIDNPSTDSIGTLYDLIPTRWFNNSIIYMVVDPPDPYVQLPFAQFPCNASNDELAFGKITSPQLMDTIVCIRAPTSYFAQHPRQWSANMAQIDRSPFDVKPLAPIIKHYW